MGSIIGGATQAYGDSQAANAALTGFNYGQSSPLSTTFGANGTSANQMLANLLGNNGASGTAVANTAFQNYLANTGYSTQLAQSQMGVTNQAAANGTYNSGGTIRAADANANSMAAGATNNFANYLSGLSNSGEQAYQSITAAGTGGGAAASNALQQGANAAGQAAGGAVNQLITLGGLI